ncbi:PAS domain-containing protein [Pseudonocardia oceani]|uniref:PAS domain-containing protein n=1 Tax=Pseudonocardia oceani TaxID=2792013 RepID=UPI001CF7D3F7|nr:PAS domain-containing protein [Pseudonocardia oceani]
MRCVYDFEGYALAASPACSSVLGWSPEELASAPYWELLHPGDQHPTVERAQQMLFSGPRRVDLEVRMLRRDGTNRRISWSCRSSVRLERVYSVGVDVTDRASVEACDRVLVGSWDWHIGSDIVAWSDGMFEIYGIRRGPAHSPATALRRLHTEDRPVVDRIIRRSVETGEPYSADHRIVLSDGDVRWLHSAGRVISGAGGSPERMRGITLDITARPGMRMVG